MAKTMEEKEKYGDEVTFMNILIKRQIIQWLKDCVEEPELWESFQRVVTEMVLQRAEIDPLFACKLKEALK